MISWLNLGALLIAISLSLVAVAGTRGPAPITGVAPGPGFQRIVSLGIVSDAALAELCEPPRVVAVSAWCSGPLARRWSGMPRLSGLDDLEAIIALHPDLVLVSIEGTSNDRVERLRAAGLRVETLGPMHGLDTYIANLAQIGDLLGRGAEARLSGRRLGERLARIADPAAAKPRAVYVAGYGGTLFGGTVGTSYHDVLLAAGCRDAAAEGYSGWPQYSREQLLALHPEIVVTKLGAEPPPLPGARVIALPGELLEDPGPRLLEAAEALHEQLALPVAQSAAQPVVSPAAVAPQQPGAAGAAGRDTATSR